MLSRELGELLEKWAVKETTFKRDVEDDILPFVGSRNVVFLYGPRRSGKSVVARRLLEKMPGNTLTRYVNLEDPLRRIKPNHVTAPIGLSNNSSVL